MQSEYNNIDNLVQDAFAASEGDTSKQALHWKQMQAMLQADVKPLAKKSNRRYALFLAALVICGVFGILVWQYFAGSNTKTESAAGPAVIMPVSKQEATPPETKDSAANFVFSNSYKNLLTIDDSWKKDVAVFQNPQPFTINFIDCDTSRQDVAATEAPFTIETFYDKITKPAQEFEMDAGAGGIINGAEGSNITILPNAFKDAAGYEVSGKVQLKLEEYYKYSDIIAANLNTVSNGEQLVTGGMIKITAWQNNKQLVLMTDKPMTVIMPAKEYDPEMQLFLGEETKKQSKYFNAEEFVTSAKSTNPARRRLNWRPQYRIVNEGFDGRTNFLDLDIQPYKVKRRRGKTIAVFHADRQCNIPDEEIKSILNSRSNGSYDKIILKRTGRFDRKRGFLRLPKWFNLTSAASFNIGPLFGDSTRLTVSEALRRKFIEKKDSAWYAQKTINDSINRSRSVRYGFSNGFFQPGFFSMPLFKQLDDEVETTYNKKTQDSLYRIWDSLYKKQQEQYAYITKYQFSVPQMGWINCDRFYEKKNTTDFYVQLPDSLLMENFNTQIVFKKMKSVMQGIMVNGKNQIAFNNIPEKTEVVLVGLGERNGKIISFMQPARVSDEGITISQFTETTPEKFREQLKQFDF